VNPELEKRLADLRLDADDDVALRHLSSMRAALLEAPTVEVPVRAAYGRRSRVLRSAAVLAAVTVILAFPLAAVASDDAMPGDPLYQVKRSLEWVRSAVDSDVAARHRIEELEVAVETGQAPAVVAERLADATAAAEGGSPELERRLERVRQQIRRQARLGQAGSADSVSPGLQRDDPDGESVGPGSGGSEGPDGSASNPGSSTVAPGGEGTGGDQDRERDRDRSRDRSSSTGTVQQGDHGDGGSNSP
jgi:hypothetical protein